MLNAIRRLASALFDCPFGVLPAWAYGCCLAY